MGILALFGLAPKRQPGVYCITNRCTGWFYIGATTLAMIVRWARHRYLLCAGRHHNKRLQADWDRYGERAFRFSVVEVVQDANRVFEREQYWQRLRHNNKCYNPHPDDLPNFIRRRIRPGRRSIDYSSPEFRAAIRQLYEWVLESEDKLTSCLRGLGYPDDVLL